MKIKIPNAEVQHLLTNKQQVFPKYSTQIINLANSNAGGTKPKVVGQMSDLIQEFEGKTFEEWEKWYLEKYPNAIEEATNKVWNMMENLKTTITLIDRDLIKKWVEDLVLDKTFAGLNFQEAILQKVAKAKESTYRLSTKGEEAKGIDGYIDEKAVSIKPMSYKVKTSLGEKIEADMIFYDKKKDGILIEFDF